MRRFVILSILFFCLIVTASATNSTISLPYSQHLDLNYNSLNLEINQKESPLYLEFQAYPQMLKDEKVVFAGPNDMTGETIEIVRPDEFAQFTITVKNKDTGAILLQDGFGNLYGSSQTTKKFVLHEKGPYLIDLYGQKIDVDLNIHSPYDVVPTPTSISTITTVSGSNSGSRSLSSDPNNGIFSLNASIIVGIIVLLLIISGVYISYKKSKTSPAFGSYIPPTTPSSVPPTFPQSPPSAPHSSPQYPPSQSYSPPKPTSPSKPLPPLAREITINNWIQQLGSKNIDETRDAIKYNDKILLLIKKEGEPAIKRLLRDIENGNNVDLMREASNMICAFGNDAVDILHEECIKKTANNDYKWLIIQMLGRIKDKRSIELLETSLQDPDDIVRTWAVISIKNINN